MLRIVDRLYTRIFFRDQWYFGGVLAALVVNAAIWGLIAWQFKIVYQPNSDLALHYKVVYGIDFLGAWYYIFMLPLGGLAFIALNYFFARLSFHFQRIAVYALVLAAVFCQSILLWATYLIIRVNIF